MLDKVRALAIEQLGSEEAADAFMAGFEKAAMEKSASLASFMQSPAWGHALAKPAIGLGASLLGAAIVKGVSTGSKAVETSNLRSRFELALSQVMAGNKVIRGARPERVKEFAETMFNFAPHVASDPNLLGYVLANVLQGDTGSGIDIKTVEMLANLESRYKDNNKTAPLMSIKT